MPDETTPNGGEGEGQSQSDKEKNFENLRQQLEAANQRIETLEPKALREDVREAGFDPSSDKGKVLVKDLSRGDVEVEDGQELHDRLKAYAESEYGWKPGPNLSDTEQRQVEGGSRLSSMQGSSKSDNPPGGSDSEYREAIAAARAEGNYSLASRLQMEYERKVAKTGAG